MAQTDLTAPRLPSHHNLRAAAVSVYTIGPPNSPHSYAAAPGIASYASYSPYARTQRRERYALPPVFEGFTPIPYSTPVATMSQTQHAPNGLPTVKSKRKNKKQQQDLEQQPLLYENGMINLQPLTLFGKRQPVDPARKKTSSRMVSLRTKQGKSSKKKESTVVHTRRAPEGIRV
nr:hypothetical protein BaRGS_010388 [Batillaria attramentaria]